MVETKDKVYSGIILTLILSIAGAFIYTDDIGTEYYLSSPEIDPTYKCNEPPMMSDCINGIKADGKRCYYAPENGRKYKNCAGLWEELSKEVIIDDKIPSSKTDALQYECDISGCIIKT